MSLPESPSFLVSEALKRGISRGALRSAEFEAPFHGIRSRAGMSRTTEQVCAAYARKLPPGSAFAGLTAARLWRMPLPLYVGNETSTVDVASRAPRRAANGARVRGSRFDPDLVRVAAVGGLPVFSPVDTWCSLEPWLDLADLTSIADHVVSDEPSREGDSGVELGELEMALDRRSGRRGVSRLRRALRDARPHCWSRTETLARLVLTSAGIPEPELNHLVKLPTRRVHLDMAWPEVRFAIEYDGDSHREASQFLRDIERQELIQDENWSIMRMTRADLFDRPDVLVQRVASRLATHGLVPRLQLRRMVRVRR
jgi:hypothetical protein